jgi:hypothetical protein
VALLDVPGYGDYAVNTMIGRYLPIGYARNDPGFYHLPGRMAADGAIRAELGFGHIWLLMGKL